ncbi:MAG: nuclear transport factor 2 family protein [Alphaproteobacteria bacterium]|nr:nuclear transport factor 2 family protein [Alphaproteobacteria bacterium]MBL6938057.1 nuclear transport factor 2 family protein [Alphaproteobacteria bacterium]MBL7099118.1 nuclear transport factor 2 family protein [Alphaproteobacteria bacterium]
MRKLVFAALLALATTPAHAESTSAVLKRQTQELYDALVPGDVKVWDKYLDTTVAFLDENGVLMDRKGALAQIVPLPKGISGDIKVVNWIDHDFGDMHVISFDCDEHENFHGQKLHALYRSLATWRKSADGWKLVAMQTIAGQQDPPAVTLPPEALAEYAGEYEAAPDLHITIALMNGELTSSSNGGKPSPLKVELKDVLFTPGQPRVRKIFVRDAQGHITGYLNRREGRDVVVTRVK